MENASKALLMAVSVLIGVLLMTLLTYVFYFSSEYSTKIKDNIAAKDVYQTNMKFEVYDGRKDLTIYDVQTINNMVKNYNNEIDETNKIDTVLPIISLEGELDNPKTYSCRLYHNENTGKINKITITKNP